MVGFHAACLLAIAVGFVSSGLMGSIWVILTDEEPRLATLLYGDHGLRTPFRVLAFIFSAPTNLLLDGFGRTMAQPLTGIPLMLLALLWSLMQGTLILTQVFKLL